MHGGICAISVPGPQAEKAWGSQLKLCCHLCHQSGEGLSGTEDLPAPRWLQMGPSRCGWDRLGEPTDSGENHSHKCSRGSKTQAQPEEGSARSAPRPGLCASLKRHAAPEHGSLSGFVGCRNTKQGLEWLGSHSQQPTGARAAPLDVAGVSPGRAPKSHGGGERWSCSDRMQPPDKYPEHAGAQLADSSERDLLSHEPGTAGENPTGT